MEVITDLVQVGAGKEGRVFAFFVVFRKLKFEI